jgi:hypothetical protein
MKVSLYQEVRPQNNSPTLPVGEYEVGAIKWLGGRWMGGSDLNLSKPQANGLATFVVTMGTEANIVRRRIGVIKVLEFPPSPSA